MITVEVGVRGNDGMLPSRLQRRAAAGLSERTCIDGPRNVQRKERDDEQFCDQADHRQAYRVPFYTYLQTGIELLFNVTPCPSTHTRSNPQRYRTQTTPASPIHW